jgi:hypothetical protein
MHEVSPGMKIYNSKSEPGPDGKIATGTIGGIVYFQDEPVILTCYHCVYHSQLSWEEFKEVDGFITANTMINDQPVTLGNIIMAIRDDRVDVALIKPNVDIILKNEIPGIGVPSGVASLSDNLKLVPVRKFGAKTKLKKGIFTKLIPSVGTDYEGEESFNHYFTNFATVIPDTLFNSKFSDKGDSGAFVMDNAKNVCGVIVMGSDQASYLMSPDFIQSLTSAKFIKP